MSLRHRTARPAVSALLAVLLAVPATAGCGVRPTGIVEAGDPPRADGSTSTITVYLLDRDGLRPVLRPGLSGRPLYAPPDSLAVEQLAVRPTAPERAEGLRTAVRRPLKARFIASESWPYRDGLNLVVDLSPEVPRRRVRWSREALAQIACTGEAIPGVAQVKLWSAPDPDEFGWGLVTCDQFRDMLR
ncbi:GerMN domain-containing protein [Actinomadura sp. 7K534]|uniref:GerMN domain-containing protein n=1 Tax=Actinomadura sp. 7K534 TaxID=2530366 RepID=UPI001051175E|nr:GerMN domain-containing protein [Actinomadura sp. 7K534]TDB96125.1 hypothetical protein E1266_10995 [Actinomadura sp. 7K534]